MRRFVNILILLVTTAMFSFAESVAVSVEIALDMPLEDYVKTYVEPKISEWQRKGEYERMADWTKRVTDVTRRQKIAELEADACERYFIMLTKDTPFTPTLMGNYDVQTGMFTLNCQPYGVLSIPVLASDADNFKATYTSAKHSEKYALSAGRPVIAELTIDFPDGKKYVYKRSDFAEITKVNVNYQLAPIDYTLQPTTSVGKHGSTMSMFAGEPSDVDINIPFNRPTKKWMFVLAVGNEAYPNFQPKSKAEKNRPYARNDATFFARYAIYTIGVPKENVTLLTDATSAQIRRALEQMSKYAEAYRGRAELIFFFSGRGMVNAKNNEPYLLPIEVNSENIERGIRLSEVYDMLSEILVRHVSIYLDADFAGVDGNVRQNKIVPEVKQDKVPGRIVVFSASQSGQPANVYIAQQHGLFTYYLLKKFKEMRGSFTLGVLADYILTAVPRQAHELGFEQTPNVQLGSGAKTWDTWGF